MRKLLLAVTVLFFCSPVWAQYAHVGCSGTCTNNSSPTTSLPLPATGALTLGAGHLVIISARAPDTAATTLAITQTAGPTITFFCVSALNSVTPSGSQLLVCWGNNISSASTYTFAITSSASSNVHARLDEYNGSPASCANPLEASNPQNNSNVATLTTATMTAAGADLLYAVAANGANETYTNTANGMFGTTGTLRALGGGTARIGAEERVLGGGGSGTMQLSWSGSTDSAMYGLIFGATCPSTAVSTMPPVVF